MMKFYILFGLVVLAKSYSDTTKDAQHYCSLKSLCSKGAHIACTFTKSTNALCIGTEVKLDSKEILKIHNDYRQKLASGNYAPLPSAAQMKELKWSNELALIASYNARGCKFQHDTCRNTPAFPKSGQNIAARSTRLVKWNEQTYKSYVKDMLDSMFNEYKNCPSKYISKYESPPKNLEIGHFTQMAKDTNTHVGCSAIFYEETKDGKVWDTLYFVCNYGRSNILGEPTYLSGNPASKCSKVSSTYKALCTS